MKGLSKIFVVVVIAAGVLVATVSGKEGGRVYVYHDYFGYPPSPKMPDLPIIINEKERKVYSGHTGFRAEFVRKWPGLSV